MDHARVDSVEAAEIRAETELHSGLLPGVETSHPPELELPTLGKQPSLSGGSTVKSHGRRVLRPLALFKAASRTMKKAAKSTQQLVTPSSRAAGGKRQSVNPVARAAQEALRATRQHLTRKSQKKQAPAENRAVRLDAGEATEGFCGNDIKTAKYNLVTFLPIFLCEVFSRAAYLYFLLQACLSWWSTVSPFGGTGSTAALTFVVVVAGVKAIWEDSKRHTEDRRTNSSTAHVLRNNGALEDIPWREVKVGQILRVNDDELFPADLLCLASALPDNVCFIKTTNLDGESNLKIRRPIDTTAVPDDSGEAQVLHTRATLHCEGPNADLHNFNGRFDPDIVAGGKEPKAIPATINEMLLRGCLLKNTGHILGLVVYTGKESRIQMNAAKTPLKVGSFDTFLNMQIGLIIILQICMVLFCGIASFIWRKHAGQLRPHLGLNAFVEGNYKNGLGYTLVLMITYWILYSYLVPISLFVTLEIVKFWQAFIFINFDKAIRDPVTGEAARARNSGLNEDLGRVEYVFSDKTGTLTSNEMQLREIGIKGIPYGTIDFKLEEHGDLAGPEGLLQFDERLYKAARGLLQEGAWAELLKAGGSAPALLSLPSSFPPLSMLEAAGLNTRELLEGQVEGGEEVGVGDAVLGHHVLDFWLCICLCHNLIVQNDPQTGQPLYQGPSPDEVALVEGARQLGFELVARGNQDLTLKFLGSEAKFQILNVMEFSSDRGRMSVIVRAPDGTIRLLVKGSDAKMLALLRPDTPKAHLEETNKNLHLFATQGLRTLLVGTRILSEEEFMTWDARYQEAAASLENRDVAIAKAAADIESDLDLVGSTAIEDKLQEGVPAAIQSLLDAGIKVWVITGDKQETAINIAISCKLINHPDTLHICNAHSPESAHSRLRELLTAVRQRQNPGVFRAERAAAPSTAELVASAMPLPEGPTMPVPANARTAEMVIDGPTLTHVLGTPAEETLAELGAQCGAVVICRASPSQKAAIVRLMTQYELKVAEKGSKGLLRWIRRQARRQEGKMLAIGDGANDVAMIQAADVGIGIMGKEGRQAVNNSDYAIGQFRFLVRLLLVHGTLSVYRLARLIKYSFFKNIAFAFLLFFFQFYNGFSGQALVDGISAAAYNVAFTSLPILLFSVLDRPVRHFGTLIQYPQTYNHGGSLTTEVFWKSGVLSAVIDAAIVFFVTYYSIVSGGRNNISDVYSMGKVAFIAMLGSVTLEVCLTARYWTWFFGIIVFLSYWLVYPFELLFPVVEMWIKSPDPAQYGVARHIFSHSQFWLIIILTNSITFGHRFLERAIIWQYMPQDNMILKEMEISAGGLPGVSNWQTQKRLSHLGVTDESGGAQGSHIDPEAGYRANANFDHAAEYHKRGQAASRRGTSQNGHANGVPEVQLSNRGLASHESEVPFMPVV